MARVTVEDCLEYVENRFELVIMSSRRARQLAEGGQQPLIRDQGDKYTVIALKEIAAGMVNARILDELEGGPSLVGEDPSDVFDNGRSDY